MKGIVAGLAGLALLGCAGKPEYVSENISYSVITSGATAGIRASALETGTAIEALCICGEGECQYLISKKKLFGGASPWVVRINGGAVLTGDEFYSDERSFEIALATLELVRPGNGFIAESRVGVTNEQMMEIGRACRAEQDRQVAEISRMKEEDRKESNQAIASVRDRTGVEPMFNGENHMNLTGLAYMLMQPGSSMYEGKFFWAEPGDYQTEQVMDGMVLMLSITDPRLPAAMIQMNTAPPTGQSWFPMFKKPLKFVGMSWYETVAGIRKQAMMFKEI